MLEEQEKLSKATVVRKKAELEADLSLLAQKSEAAAAVAEAQVLESIEEDFENKPLLFEPPEGGESFRSIDARERTLHYVEQQNELRSMHSSPDLDVKSEFATAIEGDPTTHIPPCPKREMSFRPDAYENHPNLTHEFKTFETHEGRNMTMANEITRFLVKKDLLLSRLTSFTDRPESYAVWKNSFRSIMEELRCTASEELDLFVKWLGPESKKYAVSIRLSNPNSPTRRLKRLWERLDERYGCAEMVEAALKTKLANFPRLTSKDSEKLYDLADILAEIESAKENKTYSSLLSYYDTSSGIKPIVNKLPSQIQEKWTNRAVSYKRKHDVPFPPFNIFSEFVRDMSKIKNDPSFSYDSQPSTSDTRTNRHDPQRPHPLVNARKTEVEQTDTSPEKICPLHKTRHSLNSCRVFKSKPIEERWKFLKEHRLCFRCCESDQHVKRSCKEEVKCADCGSTTHSAALHSAGIESEGPLFAHGGESDSSVPVTVSSNCLQICGDGFRGKSCAKNILVRVYQEGYPEKAKTMYAIVDDQSNRSLVRSGFFDLFGIEGDTLEYKLSSCSGLSTAYGRRARGFVVESLDRKVSFQLPTLIECDQIPGVRDEIPTPEVASLYRHLEDISYLIPPIDNQADMLILIGRDLPEIHHVMDQRIGPKNTPYAQCLPLGWVIIGEACLGRVHRSDYVNAKRTHVWPVEEPLSSNHAKAASGSRTPIRNKPAILVRQFSIEQRMMTKLGFL